MKNNKIPILVPLLSLALILVLAGPSIAQGPSTDQAVRLERELERTDQALERIADAVAQANVPLAELAYEQAKDLQARAWEAFHDDRLVIAAALTKQARERGKVALSLSRQVEQYEGAVVRRLERASENLDRVAESLAGTDRSVLQNLYESTRSNLERAWEFYRAKQYKPALKLADQVDQAARKLMQAAGLSQMADASYERRREAVRDFIDNAGDITAGCESIEAEQQMARAHQMLQLADDLNGKRQSGQALATLKRSREAAMQAVRECQGSDQLEKRYQRLLDESERLAEQAEGNEAVQEMLRKTREQLDIAREHIQNNSPEAAAAALQAARLTMQQARRMLGA